MQQTATGDTFAWAPGVTGYAGGKISACCLVIEMKLRENGTGIGKLA